MDALLFSTFIQKPILQGDGILTCECVKVGYLSVVLVFFFSCHNGAVYVSDSDLDGSSSHQQRHMRRLDQHPVRVHMCQVKNL